ncbi:alpha/beta hydrolase [Nocardioides sp. JQ2195]|uniref:alpha/beta fold hydrolase n=1 Tax=Nocardioides sp. JQ2195 TaxID=2592334 RepID=UPI00143EDC79|nr:alpha/beta hydrolase [Nocardioides sp. JQ2195]QIX26495.1 alpha/beta hydrolase [Nocardioides sp. JQ2195]
MAGWTHQYARINDLDVHYVEQGSGPLVVLLHGFPHLWYSWRHQIGPIAEAGHRVVAPDMRGMGRTTAPADFRDYDLPALTADLTGLLEHLGEEKAVFSGLDFGVTAAYDLAHLHPERVRALIGLQNPFLNWTDKPPLEMAAAAGRKHFQHIAYFTEPGPSDRDLDAAPREFLTKVFHTLSGSGNYLNTWQHPPGTTYIDAMDEAPPLPWSWLSEAELELYVENYSASGFTGGLNWYRVGDIRWEQRKQFEGERITVPYYFVGSEKDIDLAVFHGKDPLERFQQYYSDVRDVRIVPGAGHLMQMESPAAVNEAMLAFLADMD